MSWWFRAPGTSASAVVSTAFILALHAFSPSQAVAQAEPAPAADPRLSLRSHFVAKPPAIDGVLDDDAWHDGPIDTGEWLSYNPLYGSSIPQKTRVWIGHDGGFLYFAFQCDDPDPSTVKTSITRRDNIWSDDWVGVSLDAGRSRYEADCSRSPCRCW